MSDSVLDEDSCHVMLASAGDRTDAATGVSLAGYSADVLATELEYDSTAAASQEQQIMDGAIVLMPDHDSMKGEK